MKRHTRSSRQSTEDASHRRGERSTRSRINSDDLIVAELPQPSRSRKPSNESKDSRRDAAKRRHPSSSKHRTRSHSGSSNHLQEESPAKIPRRGSIPRGNSSKTDKDSPEGGRIERVKKTIKGALAQETRHRETQEIAKTPEIKEDELKVGNSYSKRARNHSGKKNSREDRHQTETTLQHKQSSETNTSPAADSSSKPIRGPLSHSSDRKECLEPSKEKRVSQHLLTGTNSQKKQDVSDDTRKISADLQKTSVQDKKVVNNETEAVPAGMKEKIRTGTSPMPSHSSDSRKTAPDMSMQVELGVNHSEASSFSPITMEQETLVGGTQKRRRNKSTSRNLAPEFNSSVKEQCDNRTKVVANSGKDSTTGGIKKMKELPSELRTSLDATVPIESGKTENSSAGTTSRTTSGESLDASKAKIPRVSSNENIKETSPSVKTSNASISSTVQSQMNNKDKEYLSEQNEETSDELLSTHKNKAIRNISKNTDVQKNAHQKAKPSRAVLDVGAQSSSSSQSRTSDLSSTSVAPIPGGGGMNVNSGGKVVPVINETGMNPAMGKQPERPRDVGYQASEWSHDVSESEPFFFESDHLALKGNKDYRMLLRTLTTLEAQREQATQDLESLVQRQQQALADPIRFVNKIQYKVDLQLPVSQRVVPLPEVNWETYLGKPENSELLQTMANQKVKTRPSNSASASSHHSCLCCKKNGTCSKSDQHSASTSGINSAKNTKPTDPKSETFNLAWTSDEQRKLEELLVKYPMEAVEARRWEKIARDLGNRTPLQVASRVQKYFIKLTRAGLPVPGRLPHNTQLIGKRGRGRYGFMRPSIPSTFLQSVVPPVFMNDNDSWDSFDSYNDDEDLSDDDSIPAELRDTDEYKELKKLKQLKNEKIRQQAQMTHLGFQCDRCGIEPIVGTRWHCSDCPSSTSTDLCQKCMDKDDYQSILHTSAHHLEPIRFKMEATYVDSDYVRFQQQLGPYNYLDTNYTPVHRPEYKS